jgi:hypothetical protein
MPGSGNRKGLRLRVATDPQSSVGSRRERECKLGVRLPIDGMERWATLFLRRAS